jgi:hypothetical protein
MKFALPLLMFIFLGFISPNIISNERGIYNTSEIDPNNIEILRPVYRFRHWKWSGIFPLYGGFIGDPHILFSKPVILPSFEFPIISSNHSFRYQVFDINTAFEDNSTELLLAIEIDDKVYEFQLDVPKGSRSFSGMAERKTDFILVPFGTKIILFTFLSVPNKLGISDYIFILETPFDERVKKIVKPVDSESFFKNYQTEEFNNILKLKFCSSDFKPFHNFYEKHFKPCE